MVGQTISHYKISEKLGEGGMRVVYKAEGTKLRRVVALKFLSHHLLNDDEINARFRREAEAAAAVTHSDMAVIHEVDESNANSFTAVEFAEGLTVNETGCARLLELYEALNLAKRAVHSRVYS